MNLYSVFLIEPELEPVGRSELIILIYAKPEPEPDDSKYIHLNLNHAFFFNRFKHLI